MALDGFDGHIRTVGALVASGVLSLAGTAGAQTAAARVALGIERGFGFEHAWRSTKTTATEVNDSVTGVGFGLAGAVTGFSIPRLGVDYVVDGGISIGTAAGFSTAWLTLRSKATSRAPLTCRSSRSDFNSASSA